MFMIVKMGRRYFKRSYCHDALETFINEGSLVIVCSDEDDLDELDIEYEEV